APARFLTFAGGHEWPPEEACVRALAWLELLAMKSGTRLLDAALVDRLRGEAAARAAALESAGRTAAALEAYRAASQDCAGLADGSALSAAATRLAGVRDVARALRDEEGEPGRQETRRRELAALRAQLGEAETRSTALARLLAEVSALHKRAESGRD